MNTYIGSIWAFGFDYSPVNYLPCDGRLVSISELQTLFVLIGTTYGGDGQTTFALPNLQGRIPIGTGQGKNLSNYYIGQTGGNQAVTLSANNMPPHTHAVASVNALPASATANSGDPTNNYFAPTGSSSALKDTYATTTDSDMIVNYLNSDSTPGGNLPVNIQVPYLVLNYSICVEGLFPPRS
jgi:microcystin-dependent protein